MTPSVPVQPAATDRTVPRWLRFVLASDRAGSAWFIGAGFLFAPLLVAVSPWPTVTAVLWALIGLAGVWLAALGIAMATGLAMMLRANTTPSEEFWRSIVDYRTDPATRAQPRTAADLR